MENDIVTKMIRFKQQLGLFSINVFTMCCKLFVRYVPVSATTRFTSRAGGYYFSGSADITVNICNFTSIGLYMGKKSLKGMRTHL